MMRSINMIQHLLLLLPLFSCATAADPRLVFAHYMLYAPDSVETLQKEIQVAYSKGIDAFALNTNVWRPELADNMYNASVGSDFKLFFSADMHSDSSRSLSADDILAMMTRYKDHPNQLTYQGKLFFSSWLGYQYDWQSVFNKAGGKANYFFVPFFPTSGDLGDVNDKLTQSNDIIDGLMAWDTSAWPYYDSALKPSGDKDSNYLQACNEKGKVYMATSSPWFFKNIQSDSCCSSACTNSDENNCNCQVKGNYQGPGLWLTRWQQIISLNPPLVEIVTWNDWLESSYVAPPLSQGDNAKSVASFTHQAYLDLGEHYIRWYKTGSEPAVTEDALYLFYYTQSKNAVATTDSCKVLHSDELSDKVYVTTVLTDAATVVLNSGSASQTLSALAGINTYSMDFSEGQQSATVSRGGSVVKSVSGGIQISNSDISRFNFNVYSTSA